jgi:EmrB/QacA subfamily drug resistance transporter
MTRNRTLLLVVVCLAQFMVVLDVSIVNVALPSIRTDLGLSTAGLQWVVNTYTLTFAGFLMLGGRAADLLGRRRMFLVGTGLFTLASLVCAASSSAGVLLGARAFQGIGGAVISPATLAIVMTSFPEGRERTRALGVWAAMAGLGASAGAVLGGLLTESVSWESIFLINVPIGIGVLAVGRGVIAEGRREGERHFDIAGATLVTAGLVGLVFGIVRSDALGWGAPGVLAPIGAGLVLLALFALVEQYVARAPLVPLSIFRRGQLTAANLVVVLLYAALFSTFFFVTLYLQQVLHYSAFRAGVAFLPTTLGVAVSSSLAERVIAVLGPRLTLTAGMLSAAAAMAWYSTLSPGDAYLAPVLPASVLMAVGIGLSLVSATVVAVQGVPREQSGLASGLLNSSRLVGGALGLATLSTIAESHTHAALATGTAPAQALTDGYGAAFVVAGIVCVAAAALAAAFIRPPRPAVRQDAALVTEAS